MRGIKKGFTLIELTVVILILGILASMGIPYYLKTVEASKAGDAAAIGFMVANSYRMFRVDNPAMPLTGSLVNNCNRFACSAEDATACRLVACSYLPKQNWDAGAYTYAVYPYAAGSSGVSPTVASANRKTAGSGGTGTAPYTTWGYTFNDSGECHTIGAAPSCPSF